MENLNPNDLFYHGWIPARDEDADVAYAWFTTKDDDTRTFIIPMTKDRARDLKGTFGDPILPEEAGIFLNNDGE